ncbi:MAG: ribonuclease H-like domain-containing protein [Deltaproteobacteria bacterium]|nr:ribonuclease H-like domain-containing protein [Deltaproteobacteria bacterium]
MLERTFIHIAGIGPRTEQRIWNRGIRTWQQFLAHGDTILSEAKDASISSELEASLAHREDISFFSERLSPGEMWRLFNAFKHRAVYLDIETTGYFQGADEISVIGIYDGTDVQTFVNGINLDDFELAIAPYDLVITFNGAVFDLPFIRGWFPHISLPPAHIDLRFLLKRLGYAGGLKKIEKDLGIGRETEINGMDGYEAVRLWQAYQWGDDTALKTLIRYNRADIVNLKPLMEIGYREMKAGLLQSA